jgi:hypothetical protein
MKRQGMVLLAVAFVAAGAAGCFKDPVSSLRGGPSVLSLDHQSVYVVTGDSVAVVGEVKDNQGNVLPATGVAWTAADQNIAVVRMDTIAVPGTYFTRGFIRGVSTTGGITTVTVAARGISADIRVVVIPADIPAAQYSVTGTASADTLIIPASLGPPPVPPDTVAYSAGDTLVINGTAFLNFDTSQVDVYATGPSGTSQGYLVAKTPQQLHVVFTKGASGKIIVKHVQLATTSTAVDTQPLDSLILADSMLLAKVRFTGSISQLGDTMTINAGTDWTFDTTATTVSFGGAGGIILTRTASQITVLSPVAYSGQVSVTNVTYGAAVLNSVATNAATPYVMNAATFPQANVTMSPNNARLGDTIIVTAPSGLSFSTTGTVTKVMAGNRDINTSDTCWTVSLSASTIKVLAKRGGGGVLSVTNLKLASGSIIPKLSTPSPVVIDSLASDFPSGDTEGTARLATIPASGVDTVYGWVNVTTAPQDFWTFTTTATKTIKGQLAWFGTGNPGYGGTGNSDTDHTADLDLLLCNAGMACDESVADLFGYAGASAGQPESGTASAQPAAQYWMTAIDYTAGEESIVYRLIITLQ